MKKQKTETLMPRWMIWIFALAGITLIPLYFSEKAIDVTLTPKSALLAILLLIYMVIFLLFPKYRTELKPIIRSWPVRWLAGFLLISIISLFMAINPGEGAYDLVRVFGSLIFLITAVWILWKGKTITPFLYAAVAAALILSLEGFADYFTYAFRSDNLDSLYKVNGIMSHKNVLSTTLFLLLPFQIYLIFTGKKGAQIAPTVSSFFTITLLFLVQTRSVWLSLVAFLLVCTVFLLLHRKHLEPAGIQWGKRPLIMIASVFILALVTSYSLNNYSIHHPREKYQEQPVVKIEKLGQRAASIFDTRSQNRVKRLDIWGRTLEMIGDHPLFGVGAGNWKIMIPDYYQPDPHESYYHNWRRPHNDFLWVTAEKGIVGIVFYLSFFVAIVVLSFTTMRKTRDIENKLLITLMLGGVAGYAVDAFFAFPYERVDLQVLLMMLVSVIVWISIKSNAGTRAIPGKKVIPGVVLALALTAFTLNISLTIIQSEKYIKLANTAHSTGQWELTVKGIDLSHSTWTRLDPANNPTDWYRGNANINLKRYGEAEEDLNRGLQQNPNSVPVLGDLARLHYLKGDFNKALEYTGKALRIYPLNRDILRLEGMTYHAIGKYQEAIENYYKCITDKPNPILDSLIQESARKLYNENGERRETEETNE